MDSEAIWLKLNKEKNRWVNVIGELPQECFPHADYKIGLETRYNKDGELLLSRQMSVQSLNLLKTEHW